MEKYRQLSEDNPRSNLGYTLIQWVKKVKDHKAYKNNGLVNGHSTITHYRDLISYEVKSTEGLKREANLW